MSTAADRPASLDPSPGVRAALPELARVAIDVARAAARLVAGERPRDLGVTTKSSRTDLVTVMDQAAQDLVVRELGRLRPADAVLGEEQGGRPGTSGITWVVDPIDGTTNFLYEVPAYAVSLAAVIGTPGEPGGWVPVASAVADVVAGKIFHACRDAGAWRREPDGSDTRLSARDSGELDTALVATGFGYSASRRAQQARLLVELLPRVRDIRRMGSAALDLCRVASGEVDAYYESGLNPWDLAGGWLVCTEAGALVGGRRGDGSAPDEGLTWACAPTLAPAFVPLVTNLTARHLAGS